MGKGLVQNPTETSWTKGMEGGDSKVSAQWLEAQRSILREQAGKYLLSGGQAWRGTG